MRILFHENQLSYRGTSVALYDYAKYNEEILGNESLVLFNSANNNNTSVEHFKKRFKVIGYSDIQEINSIVNKEKTDIFYAIKSGENDNIVSQECKTVIHTVFKNYDPHGDVYAYVSQWLANTMSNGKNPFVPHIIQVENTEDDLRKILGIPEDAIVFGNYGGADSFDINFVHQTIKKVASKNKNIYFLFMATSPFINKTWFRPFKNIIFLPKNEDSLYKAKFINTCNAFLHARTRGETFGMAIGEFSIKNKPVITWKLSDERAHIEILKDKGIYYNDEQDLSYILNNFTIDFNTNYDCYSKDFNPNTVMNIFKKVFIG